MDPELESEVVNVDSVAVCNSDVWTEALTEDDFDRLTAGRWLNDKVLYSSLHHNAIFYRPSLDYFRLHQAASPIHSGSCKKTTTQVSIDILFSIGTYCYIG